MSKRYAPDHLKNILKMKGYYVKSAQLFSNLSGYYGFSGYHTSEYRILEDQVPPRDFEKVKEIVESEFGKPIHEVYKTFDEKAFAAASIGQVHMATLHDGTKVCVKVQYPEAEKFFNSDSILIAFSSYLCFGLGAKWKDR